MAGGGRGKVVYECRIHQINDEAAKPRRGRPAWSPPDTEQVRGLATILLSQDQIARVLGIHVATLYRKKKQLGEFCEALKKGRAEGIAVIANRIFEDAKAGNTTAQIFLLKVHAGWREKDGQAEVNVNVGVGVQGGPDALQAEREQREEKKRLARLMTPRERDQQLEVIRRLRERDKAQQAGEQPAIEVQARRIEDKNRAGSNGAGGK